MEQEKHISLVGGGRGLTTAVDAVRRYYNPESITAVVTTSDAGGDSALWQQRFHAYIKNGNGYGNGKKGAIAWGDVRKVSGPLCANETFNTLKEYRMPSESGRLYGQTVGSIIERGYLNLFGDSKDDPILKIAAVKRGDPDLEMLLSFCFDDQFNISRQETLDSACIGNAILMSLHVLKGDANEAVDSYQRLFGIRGKLVTVSLQPGNLIAEFRKKGDPEYRLVVRGEGNIDTVHQNREYKPDMWLAQLSQEEELPINPRVEEEFRRSSYIVMAAGSAYTSVIAPCTTHEFGGALRKSQAEGIVIVPLMRGPGESYHLVNASDHLKEVRTYNPDLRVKFVLVNNHQLYNFLPTEVQGRYGLSNQSPVIADIEACQHIYPDAEIMVLPLVDVVPEHGWIGHNPDVLGYFLKQTIG